jgi:hypothetical protein
MTLKEAINAIPAANQAIADLQSRGGHRQPDDPAVLAQRDIIDEANKRILEILNDSDVPLCVMGDDGASVIFPVLQPAGVAGYQGWTSTRAILSD